MQGQKKISILYRILPFLDGVYPANIAALLSYILILGIVCLVEGSLSLFIISPILLLFGVLFILFLTSKTEINNSLGIYFLFIIIYFCGMLFQYYYLNYIQGTWHFFIDETKFFKWANDNAGVFFRGSTLLDFYETYSLRSISGYVYPAAILACISNLIDENSVLIQKVFSVTASALIPVFMYNMARFYFKKREAIIFSIIYGLTHVFVYSGMLLRDNLVALSFIIVFYFFLHRLKVSHLVIMFLATLYSYFLRPETGTFLATFLVMYIVYNLATFGSNKWIGYVLVVSICAVAILTFSDILTTVSSMMKSQAKGSIKHVFDSYSVGSFGIKLYGMPPGISHIALFLFGQMQLFPPWKAFSYPGGVVINLPLFFVSIFWVFVWFIIVIGIIRTNLFRIVDKKFKIMFYLSIIYLFLNSMMTPDPRRMMAVYPVIFLLYCMSYGMMELKLIKKYIVFFGIMYVSLLSVYFAMKTYLI